ncbi:hypothetical protein KHA80_15700 [Anaerobacillus sp. HL2]|nr:hypothetical protein KHA80_15700 [Anaerobacillus sp. HL2]
MNYVNLTNIDKLTDKIQELRSVNNNYPWVSRLLFNIQDKERRRLATDLHDTSLQEQLVLNRKLEDILDNFVLTSELRESLIEIKEGFLDVIYETRETCNELRPPFLKELGIIKALLNYFKKVQLRYDFIVDFDYSKFQVEISEELTITIYRIIQELLNNASKHSQCNRVDIILIGQSDKVLLKYRDNGTGIREFNIDTNPNKIGISGIVERVKSLEGTVFDFLNDNSGFEP